MIFASESKNGQSGKLMQVYRDFNAVPRESRRCGQLSEKLSRQETGSFDQLFSWPYEEPTHPCRVSRMAD